MRCLTFKRRKIRGSHSSWKVYGIREKLKFSLVKVGNLFLTWGEGSLLSVITIENCHYFILNKS